MNRAHWVAVVVGAVGWVGLAMGAGPGPLGDAVAVWHMGDLRDSAGGGELVARGDVRVGVELSGAERAASLARGGDGRVAELAGGYLDAGQGTGGKLNVAGRGFTLCVRLRDPGGRWGVPLLAKHGGHDGLVYNLFSHDFGQGKVIGFELGTEGTRGVTRVTVPLALIGETEWHDVICRFDGATLQMFVDGVWMDEGFPMGGLRQGNAEPCLIGAESVNGAVKAGWRGGRIDHAAIWTRAISDAEVEALSGGAEEVGARRARYLGPEPSMQYFRPHNQFNVGDTFPFFHDGTFHFCYLLDRGHHSSKGGLGAHQWAHASSRDLVHWVRQPLAVSITREEEASICTGSVFFHGGTYYAFYATRQLDRGEHLSVATSADGVHFAKTGPEPLLVAGPKYTNGFRDPFVFREPGTGVFHLLVSTMLREGGRGCLAHFTSADLTRWEEREPFLVEGTEVPECPDYFEWNGWYYLIFSNGQVAHYRVSRGAMGPWGRPAVDVIDGGALRVMKTAAFTGGRRIGTASIWPEGYAGWAVFRELVQGADGTLGSAFVPEMVPACGEPAALTLRPLGGAASGDGREVRIVAPGGGDGVGRAVLAGVPENARVRLRVDAKGARRVGLRLGASGEEGNGGHELWFEPGARRVSLVGGQSLADVEGLDRPFDVDVILKDHIVDVCVDGRRTLVNWVAGGRGDRLVLSVDGGEARVSEITACPLVPR